MTRKLILAGLLGATAVAAVPSVASAAPSTCTYDSAARTMEVRYGAGQTQMTIKNGATLLYQDGSSLKSCFDATTGKVATAFTTNKLTVKGATGSGAQSQTTILDEQGVGFPEQNPNLQFFVFTGTNDRLVIKEGAGRDNLRIQEQTGGLALGPMIDLNYDGKTDLRMTTSNSTVQVEAGAGNDLLDATDARTFDTFLIGEGGDDVLIGGHKGNSLFGADGNDVFFTKQGVKETVLAGGAGNDTATLDGFDAPNSIETLKFS